MAPCTPRASCVARRYTLPVRVLITRLSAFGDIVHTWPLVEALHRADETAVVAWVVEEPFAPLVAAHPGVAQTIQVATRRWRRAPRGAATFAARSGGPRATSRRSARTSRSTRRVW